LLKYLATLIRIGLNLEDESDGRKKKYARGGDAQKSTATTKFESRGSKGLSSFVGNARDVKKTTQLCLQKAPKLT